MTRLLKRWLDLREGEGRVVVQAFLALFLIIAGHTTLETARDALFLSKLPPSQLNVVYVVLAAVTFFVSSAATRFAGAFGRRNALVCSLVVAAYLTTLLHFLAPTRAVVLALYVFSGLVGAVLSPQFWLLAAKLFTVAQGRRLFGPIASGGVLGGVAGATTAAAVVRVLPVTTLLPVAATFFVATAIVLTTVTSDDTAADGALEAASAAGATRGWTVLFRENPFLTRIAALVSLTTAALLVVDYLFKSSAARAMPAAELGSFFARYYAAVNVLSLVVQLVVAGRLIRRIGIIPAASVMPFLLLGGGVFAFAGSGALLAVLALKSIDGGLRHSLNRVATELLYLPLPGAARERGKTLIDGVLSRLVQAAMAGVLLLLAMRDLATPRVLGAIVVGLAVAWLAVTVSLRGTYLDLFRRALRRDPRAAGGTELGLDAAGALVEALASEDPLKVVAAMEILGENRRDNLIPALVLYHDAPKVLEHALGVFGEAKREDWIPLAERLLGHADESVRIAAVRALAKHGRVGALKKAAEDPSSRVQAYASFLLALQTAEGELLEHPLIAVILRAPGDFGRQSRLGLLRAISDTGDPRATGVILELASLETEGDEAVVEQVAQAMSKLKDPRFIPRCVQRLARRVGREAVRDALVGFGDPALEELVRVLEDGKTPRRLRAQIPQTLARFGSQRACDVLLNGLVREVDGLVRYKLLRGLGQLVARADVRIDRARVEREVRKNLEEYLHTLALDAVLVARGGDEILAKTPSGQLLGGLLEDKMAQALARAFRLLKIAYKAEDIHRVHAAALSSDKRARANAAEFLDALLVRGDQRTLRALLRLVLEDAPVAQRLEEAAAYVGVIPKDADEALIALVEDHDEAVAALAARHAASLGRPELMKKIDRAKSSRPILQEVGERLFGDASGPLEVQSA
jgi:ATP:ADP antiporter, AAA family